MIKSAIQKQRKPLVLRGSTTANCRAVIELLRRGGIGVLPTDTIYGIVGRALDRRVVAKIYQLRRRHPKKPMIILISSLSDLSLFGVNLKTGKKLLAQLWPGKVSVILPCPVKRLAYLHRGTGTLAFRLPRPRWLRYILAQAGPLVAPSANWESYPPATTIGEAKKYFGDRISFYLDRGKLVSPPSTLISINRGKVVVVRAGAAKIKLSKKL